jgi:hypothetical protein
VAEALDDEANATDDRGARQLLCDTFLRRQVALILAVMIELAATVE